MNKLKSIVLCAGFAALLSACTDSPPESQVPGLTFDQYKPLMLNVAKIDIVDKFHAGPGAQHVRTADETAA